MKKKISVEALLRWAFNEELCKGVPVAASAWDAVERFGLLGCRVDTSHHGTSGFGFVDGEPHDDAKAVARAISKLSKGMTLPIEIDVLALSGRFGQLLDAGAVSVLKSARFNAPTLVIRCATFKTRPAWDIGEPELGPAIVDQDSGKPVVHGFSDVLPDAAGFEPGLVVVRRNPKSQRFDLSRAPRVLLAWENPAPFQYVEARVEYLIWHAALAQLRNALAPGDVLAHYALSDELPPATPWNDAPQAAPSPVVESLRAQADVTLSTAPRRDPAPAPKRYTLPKNGESRRKLEAADLV
ncbi:MAG TPA: hypothetical protein PL193_07660 [Xanthobacteraceae bacterium]|nr:hypothetical protein [Xanthobacteraceae bacterium]